MIWRAAREKSLSIQAWVGNQGLGWLFLERNADGSTGYDLVARASRAPEADDHIAIQYSVAQLEDEMWASLRLRLKILAANPAAKDMPAFLLVTQDDVAVRAMNVMGQTLNSKKNAFTELKLSPLLKQAVPQLYDFEVWFD